MDSQPDIQIDDLRSDVLIDDTRSHTLLGEQQYDTLGSEALRRWERFHADGGSYERFARRLLHDVSDAEDLVQEAALRILRHPTGPRDDSCFRAWCYGVLRNAAMDFKRSAARRYRADHIGLDQLEGTAAPSSANPETDLDAWRVMALGDVLDQRERELLMRRYVLEQTAAEIAMDLRTTPTAVRMRLKRLLAKLRGVLQHLSA